MQGPPPLGLEVVPDANPEILLDEILAAPDTAPLLLGLYEKAIPSLVQAMERCSAAVNPLADAPSRRVLRFALLELSDVTGCPMKVFPHSPEGLRQPL